MSEQENKVVAVESDKTQSTNPIAKLVKWQQIMFFLFATIGAITLTNYIKKEIGGSEESRQFKSVMLPLAERLENAQKTGDSQAVIALLDPTTKLISKYNDLDQPTKDKINETPLRYCVLASVNLSIGVTEVMNTGYWSSKDKYENALDLCR